MRITVTVPAEQAVEYLRRVADQLEDGASAGHENHQAHWESVEA